MACLGLCLHFFLGMNPAGSNACLASSSMASSSEIISANSSPTVTCSLLSLEVPTACVGHIVQLSTLDLDWFLLLHLIQWDHSGFPGNAHCCV